MRVCSDCGQIGGWPWTTWCDNCARISVREDHKAWHIVSGPERRQFLKHRKVLRRGAKSDY